MGSNRQRKNNICGCNKDHVKNIENEKVTEEFCGNGGNIKINKTAELLGISGFPFNEEAKTNSLGMCQMIKLGYRVHMDSKIDNKICVEKDNEVRVFIPSEEGLHFHDINDSSSFCEKEDNKQKAKN